MKIQEKHIYHGIALAQLAEFPQFKSVNKFGSHYGEYAVEMADRRSPVRILFIKYRGTGRTRWDFVFSRAEIGRFHRASQEYSHVFIALVCSTETVCLLDAGDFFKVIEDEPRIPQVVRVENPSSGRSLRVSGPGAVLRRTIPHSAFPRAIFR